MLILVSAKVTNFSLLDTIIITHTISLKRKNVCMMLFIIILLRIKKLLSEYNNFSIINILNLNFFEFFHVECF